MAMKTQKPIKLDSKMTLVPASMDEVRAFSSKNYRKMFGTEAAEQLTLRLNRKKTQAQEKVRAAFRLVPGLAYFFVYNGKKVGWFYGEQYDFETFYLRNAGLFKPYRRKGYFSEMVKPVLKELKLQGYRRATSQHRPDNAAVLILMLKHGFVVEGLNLDDRYGSLVRLLKNL